MFTPCVDLSLSGHFTIEMFYQFHPVSIEMDATIFNQADISAMNTFFCPQGAQALFNAACNDYMRDAVLWRLW
jgi:hypothetical protein